MGEGVSVGVDECVGVDEGGGRWVSVCVWMKEGVDG